jgi:hypothetical protein
MEFSIKGVIAVAAVVSLAVAFACSLTIQSGEAHGLHGEFEQTTATPQQTPSPQQTPMSQGMYPRTYALPPQ